jgi:PBP1b-binding outer membrane lipoprotein LpoB
MKRLLSVFVVAIMAALLCGCSAESKGKKKKHGQATKTTIVERDHGAIA